jgi:hypothetical protein
MSEPSFTRGRKWRVGLNVVVGIVSAFAVVAMVNYLAARHSVRYNWVDAAGNKLSTVTQRVLAGVTNQVKVIVYFSPKDPLFGNVTGLLKDYQLRCPKMDLEIVDYRYPGRSEKIRAEYNLSPVSEGSRIIFDCGGRTRVIGAGELSDYGMAADRQIRRTAFKGEQLFTSAILTVTSPRHLKAYFMTGHDENFPESQDDSAGYMNFAKLLSEAGVDLSMVDSLQYRDMPEDCSLLIIPGPQKRFSNVELERIDAYLKQGGRMMVMFSHCATPKPPITGLENLLANWNVDVGINVVQDRTNGKSTEGAVVVARNFTPQHPITRPLLRSSLEMVLPRSIASRAIGNVRADAPKATELVFTTEHGVAIGHLNEKGVGDVERQDKIPLAIAVEKGGIQGVAADRGATRIVVVGSSMMFANAPLMSAANADFATLALNWLLNRDVFLTEVPPRAITEYTLSITEQQMLTLRWIFMFGAPAAALLIGAVVWLKRRS